MLARYAMGLCLSVCVCVCLSQVGVLLKWKNAGSYTVQTTPLDRPWIGDSSFLMPKNLREIRQASTPSGAPNASGVS